VIVSSSLKRRGKIEQPIDPNRVSQFVEAMEQGIANTAQESSSLPSLPVSEPI